MRTINLSCLFAALALAVSTAADAQEQDWAQCIQKGIEASHSQNYAECLNHFRASLKLALNNEFKEHQVESSLQNIGWAYERLADLSGARETYETLVHSYPKDEYRKKLASIYTQQGRERDADDLWLACDHSSVDELKTCSRILRWRGRDIAANSVDIKISGLEQRYKDRCKDPDRYVPYTDYGTTFDSYLKAMVKQINRFYSYRGEGTVVIKIFVQPNGNVEKVRLVTSSDPSQSQAAYDAVMSSAPFAPFPWKENSSTLAIRLTLPYGE